MKAERDGVGVLVCSKRGGYVLNHPLEIPHFAWTTFQVERVRESSRQCTCPLSEGEL